MALLEIKNVVKRFGDYTAVNNVSLSVEAGEFFTLLGPSGCGKTTLLRMLAGFEQPDSGQILLDGQDMSQVQPEKRPVHTVFQSYALFPHMTVRENIAFPLKMAKWDKDKIAAQVDELLEDVRLTQFGDRYPHEMSGGQRQRVAIARALVDRPRLLLLDEPLSALDAKLREEMQLELINLQKEVGITFVYVTHDQGEALALSHRIAVMSHGQVEQLDAPETIYSKPKNRFVADFLGQCNVLEGKVKRVDGDTMLVDLKGCGEVRCLTVPDVREGQTGWLALRPEKVKLDKSLPAHNDEAYFKGRVHDCLYLGDVTLYVVEVGEGVMVEAMLPNSIPGVAKFFDDNDIVELAWRFDAGSFLTE
ncbi:ABC transporter ATP-binding protein [Chromobacterium haemolyticum]|uniref:Spermidine/putrescine import ATP-binding protein PotA n=2 Tax=Chromobacterium haemolyticum TaxID=394935 RepID=A0ABS3GTE4_9NEIS|nr:ABC transporter ATP-binding protein [Chromobacterium haemolyticum]MBK0417205.1 ABC transporter ATP-binding protein [Chromobacterium haemolyticum]MBO0418311.1 ABC transporter ATP-binding protein [Chromobacterium haemolyticum]MBO0501656.1 ABC transporter ATP-binding protein [Chromobacterium haemolyticum]OQS31191.1 spermidine/putrescine ABC transporter ATP-binding protein [Chromobacterium haemolyticum]